MALSLTLGPRQQIVVLITAVAVVAIGWQWWQGETRVDDADPLADALLGQPDLYAESARLTAYETSGDIRYRLQAAVVRQFEQDGITRLNEPELELLHDPDAPWAVDARTGYISEGTDTVGGGDQVFLRGDVRLTRRTADGRFTTIKSDTLTLYPAREYAETDQSVMIDTEVGRTRAIGLQADLGTETVRLASRGEERVYTIILPDQFK